MGSAEIQKYIKNRYPFLMIDRITKLIPGKMAEGIKNLSNNEWFFPCHYEENMIMPGMLQLEACIEVLIISIMVLPEYTGLQISDAGLNAVRFHKEVVPGDTLEITAQVKSCKRGIVKGYAAGYVDKAAACEAEIVMAIPDIINGLKPN